ncbi:MFS transporter [Nocardioides sp. L-11A]|uniref:MFS transporter n=1 Tax=Nocardioides sp. L-11A TaxID=3043848 RepID=UPI00249A33B5|nr:MFS transporter [Nocardioides sp. L-11A]
MSRRWPLGLLTATHVVNDFYVGAVPALLPYFAAERGYDYAAVGGVLLAGTLLSCIVQPAFGVLSDRHRLWWMVPGGMLAAGLGVGLAGLVDSYLVVCLAVALSGVGVAAYHPEAAKTARAVAGESTRGMSVFSVGGNIGLALGPFAVVLVVGLTGLVGTAVLAVPAVVMAATYVVARPVPGPAQRPAERSRSSGPVGTAEDDWRNFGILVAVIVARAIGSVGTGSFIALYLIAEFDRSASEGSLALGVFSGFGVLGTLFGGWLADRIGRVGALRAAYVLAPLAMAGVILLPSYPLGLAAAALVGFAWYMPFAVQLVLGQDYLPNRQGTASGVTLGFSITAAGLFTPILGSVADARGLQVALWIGVAALLVALGLSSSLPGKRTTSPARTSPDQQNSVNNEQRRNDGEEGNRTGDPGAVLERTRVGRPGVPLGPGRQGSADGRDRRDGA